MSSRGIWIVTIVILVVGAILLFALGGGERGRTRALDEIELGTPASLVSEELEIDPLVCPVGDLHHLRSSFGAGWSPASVDVALEALARVTDERWVYPIGGDSPACEGAEGQTELGTDEEGNILWWVAVGGQSVLQMPPAVTPAGVDSTSTDEL